MIYYQKIFSSVQRYNGAYGNPQVLGPVHAIHSAVIYTREVDAEGESLAYMTIG